MSKEEAPAQAEAKTDQPPAKKPPIKTIGIVAVLMLVQGAAVFMVAKMTGPKSAEAAATQLEGVDQTDREQTVEIPLIEDRFQNMQTGRVWIWDVSIVLVVKTRNEEHVKKELERRKAEIGEGISMIFRRAQHIHLREPALETINRQITTYIDQVMGKDAEGRSRVERVLIPKCKGFPGE